MSTTGGKDFKFEWDNFRYDKTILPFENSKIESPSVVKVIGEDDEDEWHETVLRFIKKLMESGKVTNLNQIAFLFNSVRSDKPVKFANYLEQNGILLLTFTRYIENLNDRNFKFVDEALCTYYERCIMIAFPYIKKDAGLRNWIALKGSELAQMSKNTDYAFSGMLYQMFEFSPF